MPSARKPPSVYTACASACAVFIASVAIGQSHPGAGNPLDQLPRLQAPAEPEVRLQDPGPGTAPHAAGERIVPTNFAVSGVQSLNFAEVQAAFAPLLGTSVSIEELSAVAAQVTALYQSAGYALSFCYIPEQDFANGSVRVQVVEGFVREVHIAGNPGGSEAAILALTHEVMGEHPLRSETFARLVALLARLPGVVINASVPPPKTTDGATEMVLEVVRKPFALATALDNYRPGSRGLVTAYANGLTPLGDQLSVSALLTQNANASSYMAVGETLPVGDSGLLLRLDTYHYSSTTTVADGSAAMTDKQTDARIALQASYPLILKADHQLFATAGFDVARNQDRYSGASESLPADQLVNLRILHLGLNGGAVLADQHASGSADLYHGLSGLGASLSPATSPVQPDFTRVVVAASVSSPWPQKIVSTIALRAQYSAQRLPTSEQIGFGGSQFGLGYPVSDTVGDSGWGASVEVGRPFSVGGGYVQVLQPYVSLDTAQTRSNYADRSAPRIASLALGTRLSDSHHFTVNVALARPIAALPTGAPRRSPRINVDFTYRTD